MSSKYPIIVLLLLLTAGTVSGGELFVEDNGQDRFVVLNQSHAMIVNTTGGLSVEYSHEYQDTGTFDSTSGVTVTDRWIYVTYLDGVYKHHRQNLTLVDSGSIEDSYTGAIEYHNGSLYVSADEGIRKMSTDLEVTQRLSVEASGWESKGDRLYFIERSNVVRRVSDNLTTLASTDVPDAGLSISAQEDVFVANNTHLLRLSPYDLEILQTDPRADITGIDTTDDYVFVGPSDTNRVEKSPLDDISQYSLVGTMNYGVKQRGLEVIGDSVLVNEGGFGDGTTYLFQDSTLTSTIKLNRIQNIEGLDSRLSVRVVDSDTPVTVTVSYADGRKRSFETTDHIDTRTTGTITGVSISGTGVISESQEVDIQGGANILLTPDIRSVVYDEERLVTNEIIGTENGSQVVSQSI